MRRGQDPQNLHGNASGSQEQVGLFKKKANTIERLRNTEKQHPPTPFLSQGRAPFMQQENMVARERQPSSSLFYRLRTNRIVY